MKLHVRVYNGGILAADIDSVLSGDTVPANKPMVRKSVDMDLRERLLKLSADNRTVKESGKLVLRQRLCKTNTTFHEMIDD
jgi:hypothetical protein